MRVYLVQHAEATSKDENPDRPLTAAGREDIRAVAAFARRLDLSVGEIYHSGKLRAEQTADILGEALTPTGGVSVHDGLGPVDDVEPVAKMLADAREPVILVGHLPFMPRLTGLLVAGDAEATIVNYQNGAIVCLVDDDANGYLLDWILTPDIARA